MRGPLTRQIRALRGLVLQLGLLFLVVSCERHGTFIGSGAPGGLIAAASTASAGAAPASTASAGAAPASTASAGAAPAASELWSAMGAQIERLVREVGCESRTPTHMPEQLAPPAGFDLRTLLEPFADVLSRPHVMVAGAGGDPLDVNSANERRIEPRHHSTDAREVANKCARRRCRKRRVPSLVFLLTLATWPHARAQDQQWPQDHQAPAVLREGA